MKVYIGADHRGFDLKANLSKELWNQGIEVTDVGALEIDPHDDYPIYARQLALMVEGDPEARGILICGSGAGMVFAVNKFKNIRAAQAINSDQVQAARNDDNINVLVFASNHQTIEFAFEATKAFLNTPFNESPNHTRRLNMVKEFEDKK